MIASAHNSGLGAKKTPIKHRPRGCYDKDAHSKHPNKQRLFVEPSRGAESRHCILFLLFNAQCVTRDTPYAGCDAARCERGISTPRHANMGTLVPTDQMTAADRRAERAFVGGVGDWWLAACIVTMCGLVVASACERSAPTSSGTAATHNSATKVKSRQ